MIDRCLLLYAGCPHYGDRGRSECPLVCTAVDCRHHPLFQFMCCCKCSLFASPSLAIWTPFTSSRILQLPANAAITSSSAPGNVHLQLFICFFNTRLHPALCVVLHKDVSTATWAAAVQGRTAGTGTGPSDAVTTATIIWTQPTK